MKEKKVEFKELFQQKHIHKEIIVDPELQWH